MIKIAIVAAVALNFGIAAGFGQFNPDFVRTLIPTVPSQDPAADLAGGQDIAQISASRKVRCIMPPPQQTYCDR